VDTIVYAYYDNLLNQKIARSEESIEMLGKIFDSMVYDIGSVFNWGDIWNLQHTFISQRNDNYAGFYERYEPRVEAALERTIESMSGND
jgi:hypothetical protein